MPWADLPKICPKFFGLAEINPVLDGMRSIERFSIALYTNPSGQQVWRVEGRKIGGQRVRENFKVQAEAKARKAELEIEAMNQSSGVGFRQTRLTDEQLAQAEAAFLKLHGQPLLVAVDYFMANGCLKSSDMTVKDAIQKFLTAKTAQKKLRPRTLKDYRSRLKPILEFNGNRTLRSISRTELEKLIFKPGQAADTNNGNRRVLHALFAWCVDQDFAQVNLVSKITTTARDDKEPEIMTIAEVKLFLRAAMTIKEGRLLPSVVLGLFMALRPEEIARLNWKHVDLEQKLIRIQGDVAKMRHRRVINIPENVILWLRQCTEKPIIPANIRKDWDRIRRSSGYRGSFQNKKDEKLKLWPQDVIRHTAVSYHLAYGKNEDDTAGWAGNSPTTIHTHYRGLVNPQDAVAFWSLTPDNIETSQ